MSFVGGKKQAQGQGSARKLHWVQKARARKAKTDWGTSSVTEEEVKKQGSAWS